MQENRQKLSARVLVSNDSPFDDVKQWIVDTAKRDFDLVSSEWGPEVNVLVEDDPFIPDCKVVIVTTTGVPK